MTADLNFVNLTLPSVNFKRSDKASSVDRLYQNMWYVADSAAASETKLFVGKIMGDRL